MGGWRFWQARLAFFGRLAVCADMAFWAACAAGDLRGWRFARLNSDWGCKWRFGRLAVWAIGGLGGLAVWAVGGLGGWRFGWLEVWAVGGMGG